MKKQTMVALVVLIGLSLSVVALGLPQAKAVGGLALDGMAIGSAGNLILGSATCATNTLTLTPSNEPDVIVAMLITNDTITKVNSVTDTNSLAWAFRASQTEPDNNATLFEYYTIAPPLLSSDQLTFSLSSNHAAVGCLEFAFSGANIAAPFDSNAAIPVKNSNIVSTTASLTYTTYNPNDALIYFFGMCRQSVSNGGPASFIAITSFGVSQSSNCPSNGNIGYAYYKIVTAAQSSNTYSNIACTSCATGVPWAAIGDAIQSTPYVLSISPVHGLSGSSITLTGTSFNGTTSVDFCGAKAVFTVVSDTSITATLPNCGAGSSLDITVTNAVGTSPTSPNDIFHVDPPPPLSASIIASSSAADVGQPASFSCTGTGGTFPYTYSWTFGDGSKGTGASTTHIYNAPGVMSVVCTVIDGPGSHANDATHVLVTSDPSIISFTASPPSLFPGEKVTFAVSTSGGYGSLSYSYADLPAGCLSTNATSLSCYPTSSGNYRVTVTVTERGGESATSIVSVTVGPQKFLGLPRAMGLAVIFGGIIGIIAIVVLSIAMVLRRRKRLRTPRTP